MKKVAKITGIVLLMPCIICGCETAKKENHLKDGDCEYSCASKSMNKADLLNCLGKCKKSNESTVKVGIAPTYSGGKNDSTSSNPTTHGRR
ncbi:hypothetical protein [Candidatus Hydrogenosomobacter endosymbioticus]|uniref:Lipoprotein n=1 Tax=Candidatus Hydrogenosomobacter endosymbioticus TaxID=2558174 RepID=A0ABN6L3A5_9PROT|nr:hypothetical protein [Candidatus Hydrogenosomobacter endosymbioticus]BDB96027.1 hypothetical protein HYD_1600 [Candidatus Hydrogenosomobacter endosymbioticus]